MPAGKAPRWTGEESNRGGAGDSNRENSFYHATSACIRLKNRINNGRGRMNFRLPKVIQKACLAALSKETALSIYLTHTIITSVSTSILCSYSSHTSLCLSLTSLYPYLLFLH